MKFFLEEQQNENDDALFYIITVSFLSLSFFADGAEIVRLTLGDFPTDTSTGNERKAGLRL